MLHSNKYITIITYVFSISITFSSCINHENKKNSYVDYLNENWNLSIPQEQHRYLFITANACPSCIFPTIKASASASNDSSISVIISGTLYSKFHLDTLKENKKVYIDWKRKIDRLKAPSEIFMIYTNNKQIDSVVTINTSP